MENKRETSQVTSQLKGRFQTNQKFGSTDMNSWLFEKLNVRKGENVLDVGCGTGNHIMKIARQFTEGNYYGIDISKNSISDANANAKAIGLNIKFICGDAAEAESLPDNFFDLIISVYALYYVKDTQKLLAMLKRKLKEGGRIVVMSPYHENNSEWYSFLSNFMQIPGEIESVAENFMDKEVLSFANKNFKSVKTYNFENKITIPSFEDLKNYWVSNIYYKEEFDNAFEAQARKYFEENSEFVLKKKALLVAMQ